MKSKGKEVYIQKKKLLRPYELSIRLKKLSSQGKLEVAISQLKSMPLDAQNEATWNTVILEVLKSERYQLAYRLYIDMKRRGFVPNVRTYTTLFSGFREIDDWHNRTKLLEQVDTLHSNYLDYAARIKETDPRSPELTNAITRAYIYILGRARRYQQVFDVFYAMDKEGPLAADVVLYGEMIRSVSLRTEVGLPPDALDAFRAEGASHAKLLWRLLLKYVENNPPAQVNSHIVGSMVHALSRGTASDKLFIWDIVRDYLGLFKPGEPQKPAIVPLTPRTFHEVLRFCNSTQKYRLTIHFFHLVLQRSSDHSHSGLVDEGHVEAVLRAHASLAMLGDGDYEARQALDVLSWLLKEWVVSSRPEALQPKPVEFDLVLTCCYRTGTWDVALRTFEILTGYRAADFSDDAADARDERMCPRHRETPTGRTNEPDPVFLSHLVRTALNSGDLANMRQCLRIVYCVRPRWSLPREESEPRVNREANTRSNTASNVRFYVPRLAKDVVEMVDKVVSKDDGRTEFEVEASKFKSVRKLAESVVREARASSDKVMTPHLLHDPLGGQRSLAATDSFVEYDLTVRRTLPSRSKR
ncbi:hypothetical protein DAEQUDRAFT_706989 [Daedalea quercina L-15889]|uniref:Uncharacterized protein n=1 Tax=Daedalea quercina L-15889 TaxID=1314783 RepID=A0A165S6Y9_9APHY|nr:hypothetical protein DAEQUDRAFT_706989 [Daedalea quercina L-15889]